MERFPSPEFRKDEGHYTPPDFSFDLGSENDKEEMVLQNFELGEITKKLDDERMNERFAEELWKLESGAEFDEMWLATYHDSLAHWKSKIISLPVSKESETALEEITKRLSLILEALEKSEGKTQH